MWMVKLRISGLTINFTFTLRITTLVRSFQLAKEDGE